MKKMGPNIVLTGTYSSFNKGDAAMQISTAEQIKKLWNNAEVVISTPFPEFDRKLYKNYTVIKSSRRNLLFSTLQVIRAKTYCFLNKFSINLKFLVDNEELRHFRNADIIIDLSGDTLTEDYGPHVTYSHFLPVWLGLSFNKPVFICAQSIGPFKLTKPFSRYMLNKVTKITAREEITSQYLKSIGVRKENIEVTSDMAFLLNPIEKSEVKDLLKNEGIKKLDGLTLGITISNLVIKRFNKANPDKNFIEEMARLIDKFTEETKGQVVLLGHVTGPSKEKDDRLVATEIKKGTNNANVYVIKGNYTPGQLKGIIAQCDIFMGSRMHSNIAALSSSVPLLAIGYSHKTQGIMKQMNVEDYSYSIDELSFEDLYEGLEKVIANQHAIKSSLSKNYLTVKQSSKKNLSVIKKILEEK